MRVEGVTLPEYYLAGRKRKVTPVENTSSENTNNLRNVSFEKLQQKIREIDTRPETGFLPKLDSRLALALTASNSNTTQINPQNASNQYINSSYLGQTTNIKV